MAFTLIIAKRNRGGQVKSSPLRRVSKKHARELVTYRALRLAYLEEHPVCEMPACHQHATTIHHKKKRGKYLNRVDFFMGLCMIHHQVVENNKAWSRAEGYIL